MSENKILFIRGFNTYKIKTNDTYANIHIVLSQNANNNVVYFSYSPDEDIVKVYKRLVQVIKDNNDFTHLVGHSMGGGLLMRYMYDHPDGVSKYKRVILLMPLMYKTPFNKFFLNLPFIRNISLPNALVLPSAKAYSTGNILNDGFGLSKLQQPADMYKKIMLESNVFVDALNKHKLNTVIVYAREEGYNPIPESVLKKIKNKVYVNGLHESFNSLETVKEFFEKFLPYFKN